jgi:hypothetical protein
MGVSDGSLISPGVARRDQLNELNSKAETSGARDGRPESETPTRPALRGQGRTFDLTLA